MFSIEIARQLVSSAQSNEFVVDFDLVWEWLGYSTKANAKRKFEKAEFLADVDFRSFIRNDKREIGATQTEVIFLTVDCVKHFCMMANTEQGKLVRRFFIEAEKELRLIKQNPSQTVQQIAPKRDAIAYIDAKKYLDACEDPIFKSFCMQQLYEDLGVKSLPQATIRHVPIAVLAREMGYSLKPGQDSALGKHAVKYLVPTGKAPHGRYQINLYEENDRTKEVISAFFR